MQWHTQLDSIIVLDFGGQYAHLIASRIRRMGVYACILSPEDLTVEMAAAPHVKGIILSGGPQSVYEKNSPQCNTELFALGKPMLGICYGHQFLCDRLGGKVQPGTVKEYGPAELETLEACSLLEGIPNNSTMWMSHGDSVTELPEGFKRFASTADCANAGVWNKEKNLFGIQFHPEVTHSEYGLTLLENFVRLTSAGQSWTMKQFLAQKKAEITKQVGDKNVLLFVSGGVDSSVAFALLTDVLGPNRVKGLFVDTGLMRKDEVEYVETALRNIGADLMVMSEGDRFFGNIGDKTEPEAKRVIIGNSFLDVQKDFFAANQMGDDWVLAQGTIYPDTIETGATKHAAKIKTHHNRVPEVEAMIASGRIIEPISDLYKDEVRALGELLELPAALVWRHPFPGPGLGVRVLCADETTTMPYDQSAEWNALPIQSVGVQGDFRTYRHPGVFLGNSGNAGDSDSPSQTSNELLNDIPAAAQRGAHIINTNENINRMLVPLAFAGAVAPHTTQLKTTLTRARVAVLQEADAIVNDLLQSEKLMQAVWQFPVVLTPLSFHGDDRETIILRPVDSIDAMSATVSNLPKAFFEKAAREILANVPQVGAVLLDITSKPPGTIEWE